MFTPNWRSLLVGAVVAATMLTGASQSDAFWGWGCYSSCYTPCYSACYTPCYSACYDPCGYTGYGWYAGYRRGPIRRALFGPYRSYYGGYYSSWSSCCDPCGWDTCCGDVAVTTDTATAVTTQSTPTPATRPAPETPPGPPAVEADVAPMLDPGTVPAEPPPMMPGLDPNITIPMEPPTTDSTGVPTRENSGLLVVYVPYDAKVTVNGFQTHSKGSRRQYVSYDLRPGFSYKYVVRAEVVRDGQRVEEFRSVVLTAGDRSAVAFGFNTEATEGLASR